MKRIDLIINALDRVDTFDWNQQDNKLIKDALAAARELRELKPACWVTPESEGWRMRFEPPVNDVPMGWTKLYALRDKK